MADGTTYANFGGLKQVYDGKAPIDLLQRRKKFFDELKTGKEKLKGQGLYTDIRVGGNEAISAITEDEALPAPQHQRHVQPKVLPKIYVGTHQISDLTIAMAGDNEAAFADALEDDLSSMAKSMDKRLEKDAWRTGKTYHGTVATTATSATQTVDAAWSFSEYAVYDLYDTTLATRIEVGIQVLSKSVPNNTVTFNRSFTGTATNVFVPTGELVDASSDGKCLTGLEAIVDDGTYSATYLTVSRSTYKNWQALVYDASSASVSGDMLQQQLDRIELNSEGEGMKIRSHVLQRRKYLQLVTPQVRFSNLDMDAGYNDLEFNGMMWRTYVDCPKDRIYINGEDPEVLYTPNGEMQFVSRDGSRFFQRQGYLGKWAARRAFLNMICRNPNRNAVIKNLATPTV